MIQQEIASNYLKTAYEDTYLNLGDSARMYVVRAYKTLGYDVTPKRIDEIMRKFIAWSKMEQVGLREEARTSLEKFIEDFVK
mgnify:CR=1 FL=1